MVRIDASPPIPPTAPTSVLRSPFLLLKAVGQKPVQQEIPLPFKEEEKAEQIKLRKDPETRFSIRKKPDQPGLYEIMVGSYQDKQYVSGSHPTSVDGRLLEPEEWFPLKRDAEIKSGDLTFIFKLPEEPPIEPLKTEPREEAKTEKPRERGDSKKINWFGNSVRATAWTLFTAAASLGLGEGCKRAVWADVDQTEGGIQTRVWMAGILITAITNTSSIDLFLKEGEEQEWFLDEAKKQIQIWNGTTRQNRVERCERYRTHLDQLLKVPKTSDGMKEIHIEIVDEMADSILSGQDIDGGGHPTFIKAMHRVNDKARDSVRASRTVDDYDPLPYGALALAGLMLAFFGYMRRDKSQRFDLLAREAGYLAVMLAGLLAVREADSNHRVHALPKADTCQKTLTRAGFKSFQPDTQEIKPENNPPSQPEKDAKKITTPAKPKKKGKK